MTVYFLDVNILLALSWPGHKSHAVAQKWFGRNASSGGGGVRSHPLKSGFFRPCRFPIEATEALGISTKHPSHQFWPDDISLAGGLTNLQDRIGAINKSRTRICWPLRFITMGGWQR